VTAILVADGDAARATALRKRVVREGYEVETSSSSTRTTCSRARTTPPSSLPGWGPACGVASAPPGGAAVRRFGSIAVDMQQARVCRDGRDVPLSPRQYQLLRCFVESAGALLSRDELPDRVWGRHATPTPRTVDVHVAWLRRKLEDDPTGPTLTSLPRWSGRSGARRCGRSPLIPRRLVARRLVARRLVAPR
jgi:DNA-binding response OmpR family regulator